MKKVLFLLHIPGPIHGSSIIGQYIYKSALVNSCFDCQYINLLASSDVSDTGKVDVKKIFRFFNLWISLPYKLIISRPDLCYFAISVNGWAFLKDLLLVFWFRIFMVDIVYHFHNKGIVTNRRKIKYHFAYCFAFYYQHAIVLSPKLKEDIAGYFDNSKIFVLPNGINSDEEALACLNKEKFNNIPNILFLSNLFRSKGIFVLLDALSLLKNKNVEFSCNIIGGEGDVSVMEVENYIRDLFLDSCVKYHGRKIGEEKNVFFKDASLFVFPTENECFPLVLLEAMKYGLPIVSCRVGGIEDMVKEGINGYLVNPRDHDLLANKIQSLLLDVEKMKVISECNMREFKENYTLRNFEEKLCVIINTVTT